MIITNDDKNLFINGFKVLAIKNDKGKTVKGSNVDGLWCDIVFGDNKMRLKKKQLIRYYKGKNFTTANNIYLSL